MAALLLPAVGRAAPMADTNAVTTELRALITKVQSKLQEGKRTEAEFSDELKQFDALLAKHKDEKSEAVARVLFMKAMLYEQVFKDHAKAEQISEQLQKDFPDTRLAKLLAQQQAARKAHAALAVGAKFPDFDEKDVEGKPLSIANYKGKVVLVDFWATWCGPCVGELPNVIKTYQKHHPQGFEIIGVSLDQDKQKLTSFLTQRKVTWQQYFDGKGWQNKLASKCGIQSIPSTFLLDGTGKIIGTDLRGEELEDAVTKALAKN